ncbi:MAG: tRNA (adenosine(37)-N6)-dimethylallyltransferase MiaA [Patescibacteria group bacterium]
MADMNLPKVIVLVGPTASGKTAWGLRLAKEFHGEIISADSRQIYTKMDIGTAKQPGEWRWDGKRKTYVVEGVPHALIDFLDPGKQFTVAEFREAAIAAINGMVERGKVPFVIGGTGLYIQALVDNYQIPRVAPNRKLRKSLEGKNLKELVVLLSSIDPETVKYIDTNNVRRVIRALEVCILTGKSFLEQQKKGEPMYQFLELGIRIPREHLYERIEQRVEAMLSQGLVEEVEFLLRQKYSWGLPSMSGIGYRQFQEYSEGKISLEKAVERLKRDTRHFARRQMTWFRRDAKIEWCEAYEEAQRLVESFLSESEHSKKFEAQNSKS